MIYQKFSAFVNKFLFVTDTVIDGPVALKPILKTDIDSAKTGVRKTILNSRSSSL